MFPAVKVISDRILDTCVAGGVEILGAHATVAPRKQMQAAPVLEEFHFVPYTRKNIGVGNKNLEDYLTACKSCISSLFRALSDSDIAEILPNSELFKECLNNVSRENIPKINLCPDMHLLKLLEEILSQKMGENFLRNVQNIVHSYQDNLETDVLLVNPMSSIFLKPCIDIVLENAPSSTKMKILEIDSSKMQTYKHVVPLLNTQPMLTVDYTALEKNLDSLDESTLETFHVNSVKWDYMLDAPPSIPTSNLVIANHILSHVPDKTKVLSYFKDFISDDGFILVHEFTQNFAIPFVVSGFSDTVTCYWDEKTWTEFLTSCGLEIVASVSDGFLSSMFLCRKCSEVTPNPVIIGLNDMGFDWVEDLKTALKEPASDRIWLVSDSEPSSGIVGMVNCLKQEPGGEKIRYCIKIC